MASSTVAAHNRLTGSETGPVWAPCRKLDLFARRGFGLRSEVDSQLPEVDS